MKHSFASRGFGALRAAEVSTWVTVSPDEPNRERQFFHLELEVHCRHRAIVNNYDFELAGRQGLVGEVSQ
ncbi:hypothetical protein GCM10009076_15080 [Erythrobacter ramosus]